MSYVIYHDTTTRLLKYSKDRYATIAAAKGARTKILKKHPELGVKEDYYIVDTGLFYDEIEIQETRTNLMSGKEIKVGVNTPCYMDPSSEAYWSM